MNNMLKQRMYSMVLRQLSPMQKGVQSLHAVVEYANNHFSGRKYSNWSKNDKTMIILDAGTSQDLEDVLKKLDELYVDYSTFREPDLYNQITAFAFLADERVWDTKTYPDYETYSDECTRPKKQIRPDGTEVLLTVAMIPPTKKNWAETVLKTSEKEADMIIELRNLIFSKKLSQ